MGRHPKTFTGGDITAILRRPWDQLSGFLAQPHGRIAGNRYVEYINGLIPEAPAGLRDYFFAGAVQLIEPTPLAPYCT
jgi:hypothetical protein